MNTFWKLSIYLTVIGSAYSSVQYYRNIKAAQDDVTTLKPQVAQQQAYNLQRQAEWDKITKLFQKKAELAKQTEPFNKRKEELERQFRSQEGEFKYLAKSIGTTVEKVRAASTGQTFPEIKLTDGKVLKDAKIRKIEDSQVSFIHADGIGTLAQELLPADLREKLDLGSDSIVLAITTTESNLFSPGGEQEYDGLTLRCPFVLKEIKDKLRANPPLLKTRTYEYKSGALEISLLAIWYQDGFPLSMDEAVAGAVKNMAALEGVTNPRHEIKDVQISGSPAKRVIFTANRFGSVLYADSLYVLRGQRLWLLQAHFSEKSKDMRPLVNSLLDSVQLQAAK